MLEGGRRDLQRSLPIRRPPLACALEDQYGMAALLRPLQQRHRQQGVPVVQEGVIVDGPAVIAYATVDQPGGILDWTLFMTTATRAIWVLAQLACLWPPLLIPPL